MEKNGATMYIVYLDLLGTKESSKDAEVYSQLIEKFSKAVMDTAWNLKNSGKVGMFSDSVYAESSDLKNLLDFLVQLRFRLFSESIFFNAVVKKGDLNTKNISNGSHFYGTVFSGKDIASLYNAQVSFKGIGIFVDKSIEKEAIEEVGYHLNDSVFIQYNKDDKNIQKKYYPVRYKDISFLDTINYNCIQDKLFTTVLNMMYSSYLQSPKYGRYYISVITNLLRSNIEGCIWNKAQQTFSKAPTSFALIFKMLSKYYSKLCDFPGVEFLTFILLDIIYMSDLDTDAKEDITKQFTNIDFIQNKYVHFLEEIPDSLFTIQEGSISSNRERFIQYCKKDLSRSFVNDLLNDE